MKKIFRKYIPIIILVFLLFFSWLEESIIGEGYFNIYLHLPQYKILRFFIRGVYAFLLFVLGYIGLSNLSAKWVKVLWIYLYAFALLAVGLRVMLDVYFLKYFTSNSWSFLATIYFICETPFPYIFLLLLAMIAKRNKTGK